jgi:hypothetical protein
MLVGTRAMQWYEPDVVLDRNFRTLALMKAVKPGHPALCGQSVAQNQ